MSSRDFENIIRPFQTRGVAPPRRILPVSGTKIAEPVLLEVGKSGSTKTFSTSYSASATVYVEKWPKET